MKNVHPFGLIPALQDGETQLFESRAICRYLVYKYGKGSNLVVDNRSSPGAIGKFEQAASVEYSYFDPSFKTLAYENIFKRLGDQQSNNLCPKNTSLTNCRFMGQGDPNLEEVDRATGVQNSVLDYYNNLLATSQYIGGDVSSAALEIMSKGFKSNFLSILLLLISTTFLGSDSSLCCPSSIRSLRDQTLMLGGNEFQIARLGRLFWPRFLIK